MAAEPNAGDAKEVLRASLIERLEQQMDLPAWLVAQGYHLSPTQPDPTRLAHDRSLGRDAPPSQGPRSGYVDLHDQAVNRRSTAPSSTSWSGATGAASTNASIAWPPASTVSNKSREPLAYREALSDRDNVLRRAAGRHIDARQDVERDALTWTRTSRRQSRGRSIEWRFGRPSSVLRDPDSARAQPIPLERSEHGLRRATHRRDRLRANARQAARHVHLHRRQPERSRRSERSPTSSPTRRRELTVVPAFARDRRGAALAEQVALVAVGRKSNGARPNSATAGPTRCRSRSATATRSPALHRPPATRSSKTFATQIGQGPRRRRRPGRDPHRHHPPPVPQRADRYDRQPLHQPTTSLKGLSPCSPIDASSLSLSSLLSGCPMKNSDPPNRTVAAGAGGAAGAAATGGAAGGAAGQSAAVGAAGEMPKLSAPDAAVGNPGKAARRGLRRELRVRLRLLRRRRLLQHRLRRPVLASATLPATSATAPARSAATTPPRPRPARGPTPARSRSPSSTCPPAG